MEIINKLKALADKIEQLKGKIETEEATKHAFVLPFINLLGYDTFDPTEVVPEFTADLGLKKGEKVDYAIFQDDIPILIIECKNWRQKLDIHGSQLFRYFHVSKTKFSLLTNGIEYKFYTDLEESNKMDEKPFLEFNLTDLKDNVIKEIEKFHKSNFDVDKIFNNASSLKYSREIRNAISNEMQSPSPEFVKLFANKVYSGRLTASVMEEFTDLVQKAFSQMLSERVNSRLNAALSKEAESEQEKKVEEVIVEEVSKIDTTEEELDAYRVIVAILRRKLPIERIAHRDTQSYFGVLLDDNNRKPICRLYLNSSTKKYLSVFDENKVETKHSIESIDEIYNYEEQLLKVVEYYEA